MSAASDPKLHELPTCCDEGGWDEERSLLNQQEAMRAGKLPENA